MTESLTINGAGQATTIIDGNNADAIIDTFTAGAATIINLNDVTLQNGNPTGAGFEGGGAIFVNDSVTLNLTDVNLLNNTANLHGGAIHNRGTMTINNATFSGNQANGFGGAIYNVVSTASSSTISNSTFNNNQAEYGGAIYTSSNSGINLTVTDSTFTSNQALDRPGGPAGDFGDGAAIYADTDANLSITESTFTGNSAARNGGALFFKDSTTQVAAPTLTMNFNRIVGNSATTNGSGVFVNSGTATIENNWWGCNAGPASAPCDRVSGTADFNPWLTLTHTASPNPVSTGANTTLTASFLTNSAGNAIGAGNLGALIDLPITFNNGVLGSLSGAQTTIQANGQATATFTAGGTPGAGSANATVDSQTTTANITIQTPPDATPPDTTITASPANLTNSTSASFSFTGTDNVTTPANLTFACQIDNGGWEPFSLGANF